MNNFDNNFQEIEALSALAEREIEKIKKLTQPVVRVCGPLTCDGLVGYERNANRLAQAEKILQEKGLTVWKFGESEEEIFGKNYSHKNIFTYFHKPVLESGLIKQAYFLPRWDESNGATLERNTAIEASIDVLDFPEDWFNLLTTIVSE
ncbi:DUF4406 domain-containing protein [Candidatus Nomurabacteria bacterium]|nr:DUF4406 domain-containing protein [Candidatus Nomurabacteria bacterium]